MLFRRFIHATDAELSAYLDEQLGARIRDRVAGHLDKCAICQRALEGLRSVRASLRGLPRVRASRSFALREADVRPALPLRRPSRAIPALSGLTVVAILAFFAVVGWDLTGGGAISSQSSSNKGAVAHILGPSATGGSASKGLAMTATFTADFGLPSANGAVDSNTTPPLTASALYDSEQRAAAAPATAIPTPAGSTAESLPESSSSDTGTRIAEAALASVALVLAGGTVVVWRWRSS